MIDCAYRGLHGMSLVGSRTFWWCGALFIIWEEGASSSCLSRYLVIKDRCLRQIHTPCFNPYAYELLMF